MSYLKRIVDRMTPEEMGKLLLEIISNESQNRLEIIKLCFIEILPTIPMNGNGINMIKAFRTVSGLGLKESKEFIEKYIGTAVKNSTPFDNVSRT